VEHAWKEKENTLLSKVLEQPCPKRTKADVTKPASSQGKQNKKQQLNLFIPSIL